MSRSRPEPSPAQVDAPHDGSRNPAGLPEDELGGTRELVGDGDLRRAELVARAVAGAAEVEQRHDARDTERDVDRALPERTAE